ncbi:MAG TPA: hypothetical protein VFT55_14675 [Planctomycetota bacterium]|nr:hypothetical protein [Planctomycetota bacterium]
MFASRHVLGLAAVLALGLGSSGCTLVKPVVGAFVGPVVMLGSSGGDFSGCGCNGEGILAALSVMAVVGAGAGLITGIISDVRVICGCSEYPTNNWWDPFKINNEVCDR